MVALCALEIVESPYLRRVLVILEANDMKCENIVHLIARHWPRYDKILARRFLGGPRSEDGRNHDPCTLVLAFIVGHDFASSTFFSQREGLFSLFGGLRSQGHHVGLQLYQASDKTLIGQIWSGSDPPIDYVRNARWFREKYYETWMDYGSFGPVTRLT